MKSGVIEKIGTFGALLAAAACPACFPLVAVAGTAVGLGIFQPFEGWVFIVFQLLVMIAMLGTILSFLCNRRFFPLIIGLAGPALIFVSLYVRFSQLLLYVGLFDLVIASVLNFLVNRQCA
jgi:mercuric ion transport protein